MASVNTRTDSFYSPEKRGTKIVTLSLDDRRERLFDRMVLNGDIEAARELIGELATASSDLTEQGYYPQDFGRILIKELSLPLYERAFYDTKGKDFETDPDAIAQVYPNTLELLKFLKEWYATERHVTDTMTQYAGQLRGDISELAILALTTRRITGKPTDFLNIVPSGAQQDHGKVSDKRRGLNKNVDFYVTNRTTNAKLPIQVKTREPSRAKRDYAASIALVRLDEIAGIAEGHGNSINVLLDAMVGKLRYLSQAGLDAKIEPAADRLHDIYYARLGKPALDLTQL